MGADNCQSSSDDRGSSSNAIEELKLLEDDNEDESEWNEPPKTVFDRDALEESKINHLIKQ